MHDIDDSLRALLVSAELATPAEDHREAITVRVRRVRRRQRTLLAVPIVAGMGVIALAAALGAGGDDGSEVADRSPSATREVEVAGVPDPIVMSLTTAPVPEARSFGSIPLAGGAVTGATQTALEDGRVVVLVAVTPGPGTAVIEAIGPRDEPARASVESAAVLLTVPLPAWDPTVVVEVRALGPSGALLASARVAPFTQNPLTCETNGEQVGSTGAVAGPSRIPHLDAFLGAQLPAVCS